MILYQAVTQMEWADQVTKILIEKMEYPTRGGTTMISLATMAPIFSPSQDPYPNSGKTQAPSPSTLNLYPSTQKKKPPK